MPRTVANHRDRLNPPQREAVETLAGPLLVLAGAGTGKTRVVTYRIARLIRNRVPPARILAVTFTNKAAGEMRERALALVRSPTKQRPEISTFHSLCLKILRRHAARLGYPPRFGICDRGDQESIARDVLRELRVEGAVLRPGDLLRIISGWKSAAVRPAQAVAAADTDKDHLAAMGYRRYQHRLKAGGIVDFDDLLLLVEELFNKFPAVRREEAGRFDHLLIDEYQDTNGSQYRIVRGLAAPHRNLCVVGDDDQSIYGWRGADVAHILRFQIDWPDAKVVRLVDNYRSTAPILEMANRLIAKNKVRHAKELIAARGAGSRPRILQFKDETAEAEGIVADIRRRLAETKAPRKDFAILFRTNQQPRSFETALRQAELPYQLIGGMSFFDRREVRDVLAYLRVVADPHDETALLRIVNTPPRGLGQTTVARLLQTAVGRGVPLWKILQDRESTGALPAAAQRGIESLRATVLQYQQRAAAGRLAEMAGALVHEVGYPAELARLYPDPNERDARLASVEEVINALATYEKGARRASLREFLDQIALADREAADDKQDALEKDAIALLTLHSAKGLEFPYVYLVGLEEGILPHHRSVDAEETGDGGAGVEEERRLCYVGVTRAKDELTLSLPLTRMKWGKSRETIPSRFLYELTGADSRK